MMAILKKLPWQMAVRELPEFLRTLPAAHYQLTLPNFATTFTPTQETGYSYSYTQSPLDRAQIGGLFIVGSCWQTPVDPPVNPPETTGMVAGGSLKKTKQKLAPDISKQGQSEI